MSIFSLVSLSERLPSAATNRAYLVEDKWDDWAKYRTQFHLWIFTSDGTKIDVGDVKIASIGLQAGSTIGPGVRAPAIPKEFSTLGDQFFSLGQGETYYEALNTCPEPLRELVLTGLRDCARDLALFESMQGEYAMQESLLRGIPAENVRSRLHRLAIGDATLTRFWFSFEPPIPAGLQSSYALEFKIEPYSYPPTNVHVLIGRNGVGKSRCLQKIARAVLKLRDDEGPPGTLTQIKAEPSNIWITELDWEFAGLVFVSFSAFDQTILCDIRGSKLRTAVVGLHRTASASEEGSEGGEMSPTVKSKDDLLNDFLESFAVCRRGLRVTRLRAALETLGTDPLFTDADIDQYFDGDDHWWREPAGKMFSRLSSGHAVVLLTISRLVEFVDERTLVLIDEPEGHLHPPLLSAFIRSLTDLLIKRNGVAIVSTHSPVVLQEVPKSCVWKLRRSGVVAKAERISVETFGENVGTLTREVFGLEVTNSGFHKMLRSAIEEERLGYDDVVKKFGDQLGAEARAIVRALVAERDAKSDGSP